MTTYYVKTPANGGSDANAGTSTGAAWATLQHAADNVSAGDTVSVFPGEYDRFNISSGGSAAGGVITFEANDQNDRPYVRTDYYNIADSALGSTDRPDAGIYITTDYVTVNGFRFTNERAIAIAFQLKSRNTYNITVGNCYFYRCRAVLKITAKLGETMVIGGKTVKIDKKATGPIWISHKGKGYANRNIHFHDLEFIECWARVPVTGGGTEIVTFNGAHDGILVEDCYWKDCYGINLNFLGVDSTNPGGTDVLGQPRNIVARRNTFINAFRTNDGVQASVNSLYFDRGTGPAEIYENLFYNNASRASVKSSFEGEWRIAELVPNRRIVFRDNVMIAGDFALALGTGNDGDINAGEAYNSEDIGVAHNVLIVSQSPWDVGALQMSSVRRVSVRNNVLANYGGGKLVNSNGAQSASDIASWDAAGNIVWTTQTGSTIEWGINRWMTPATFNSNVQGGTGWITKPAFAHGLGAIDTNTNLTGLDLADWTLASDSPGYKAAQPLTYASGSGTDETDITVDDAKFFAPGIPGLGVAGTTILIGGNEAVVTGVNHTTNVLSLDREMTWSDDDEIRYKPTTAGVYSVGITSAASTDVVKPDEEQQVGNLLANGYFDDGNASWFFDEGDGAGSFSVINAVASANILAGGSTIQLYQFDLPITNSNDYVLTLYGSSGAAPQTVTVKVILHASPNTNLGLNETIELTSDCQAHTLAFTATGSSANARLQLLFTDPGLVTIQGVYLGAAGGAVDQCPENQGGGSVVPVSQNLKVAAGEDDWGDNNDTYFGTTATVLAGGGDKDASRYDYRLWVRLQIATTIAQGDVVTGATLRLFRSGSDSGAGIPDSRIYAQASTNTSRPADATASKALPLTTAYVDWTMDSATSEWKEISGLETILQELLETGDLTAGNYISLVVAAKTAGWGGSNSMQYFKTYDADPIYGAELTITSVTPSTGGSSGGGGESDSTIIAIASGADDLDYRPSGAWVGDSTNTHRIGLDSVERAGIMRFILDKEIPEGSTIDSAILDLYADVNGTGSGWDITISVADAADPAMPTSNAEIDAHTWEDSATTWQPSALSADTRYDTSDFADALQAVVDSQGGLANGAAILIKQRDAGAVAGSRLARFESYDGSVAAAGNATRAANLELAWTTPGGAVAAGDRVFAEEFGRTFNETWSA